MDDLNLAHKCAEVATMREHVAYWMLMSRLHIELSDWEQACRDLLKARQLQLKVISDQ